MNKIAEQKALEAYPFEPIECGGGIGDSNSEYRGLYQEGYDQSMQDFMEKAEKFLKNELYMSISDQICSKNNFTSMSNFIEHFKNYMKK